MDFKRIKCPHCGKELPVPQDSKSLMCIFCFNLIELSDDNVSGKLSEDEARKEEFAVGGAVTSASPSPTSPEKSEQTWKASDRLGEAVPPVALQKSSDFGATSPATKNRKLLYIVAGFVCVMLFLIMANVMNRHGNDSRNAASTAQSSFNLGVLQPQENSETGMPAPASQEQSPTKEKGSAGISSTPMPSQPSTLHVSLGGICIGYNKNKVYSLLGKEKSITDPSKSGHLRYQYRNMEVVITNGIVTGFISKNATVQTERGIHEGSTLRDVLDAYGNDYSKFTYENATLYEYNMQSIDGKDCLQRFAIKNGRVDYISCRVLDAK